MYIFSPGMIQTITFEGFLCVVISYSRFHLTDRVLHAVVSALAYPVALAMLAPRTRASASIPWQQSSGNPCVKHNRGYSYDSGDISVELMALVVALLFASHPIHVEAVANTTGRAEVLCTAFYFLGFLVYATFGPGAYFAASSSMLSSEVTTITSKATSEVCSATKEHVSAGVTDNSATAPCLASSLGACAGLVVCSWASLLSKEHGATLPLLCIAWDVLLGTQTNLQELAAAIYGHGEPPALDTPAAATIPLATSVAPAALASTAASDSSMVEAFSEATSKVSTSASATSTTGTPLVPNQSQPTFSRERRARGHCRIHPLRARELKLFVFRALLAVVGCSGLVTWRLAKNHAPTNNSAILPHRATNTVHTATNVAAFADGLGLLQNARTQSRRSSRMSLSPTLPNFSCEQNPGACLPLAIDRWLHFSWLACCNVGLLVWPMELSPDWSGPSIRLLTMDAVFGWWSRHWWLSKSFNVDARIGIMTSERSDEASDGSNISFADLRTWVVEEFLRAVTVLVLYIGLATWFVKILRLAIFGEGALLISSSAAAPLRAPAVASTTARNNTRETSCGLNGSGSGAPWVLAWAWVLGTYLLSSNLLVYVGFVIADRALYLPSFGYCLLLAQVMAVVANYGTAWKSRREELESTTDPGVSVGAVSETSSETGASRITSEDASITGPNWAASRLNALAAVVVAVYVAKQQAQTDRYW